MHAVSMRLTVPQHAAEIDGWDGLIGVQE